MGVEVSWLLPRVVGLVVGLWLTRRRRAPTGCGPACCCGAVGFW